jgi:hypothetical protein
LITGLAACRTPLTASLFRAGPDKRYLPKLVCP